MTMYSIFRFIFQLMTHSRENSQVISPNFLIGLLEFNQLCKELRVHIGNDNIFNKSSTDKYKIQITTY